MGAMAAGSPSIGIQASLITNEKVSSKIFTHRIALKYLFVRRFLLAIKSDALIFYPGGYGTLNELFEYVVLIQTGMVDKVPLICVNKKYWEGLFKWVKMNIGNKGLLSDKKDLGLIQLVDDVSDVVKIIEK